MVRQVCRRLHHAPRVARGTHAPAVAGKGYEVVVPAIAKAGAGKTVGKDAAFQIFAKRLANKNLWGVAAALPVKLASTGEFMPSLKVLGNRWVQQRACLLGLGASCYCCYIQLYQLDIPSAGAHLLVNG